MKDSILLSAIRKKYRIENLVRPKVVATKQLNLSGEAGVQIVRSETKLVLRTHKKTFAKLGDM